MGADPEKHGAADCPTLTRAVAYQALPVCSNRMYRRLRRGDTDVFAMNYHLGQAWSSLNL